MDVQVESLDSISEVDMVRSLDVLKPYDTHTEFRGTAAFKWRIFKGSLKEQMFEDPPGQTWVVLVTTFVSV